MEQIVEFTVSEAGFDEAEADCRLFNALTEVAFVEGESQIAVFEHVISARLVVAPSGCFSFHVEAQCDRDIGSKAHGESCRESPAPVVFGGALNEGLHLKGLLQSREPQSAGWT